MARNPDHYDRDAIYCAAMLDGIEREMPDVTSFTRDDIMYLSTFSHVATITRYFYVRLAIRYGLDNKKIVQMDRTTFVLAGNKRKYTQSTQTMEEYENTVKDLILAVPNGVWISVPNLLRLWTSDQYLSQSGKRTILRETLKRLEREDMLERVSFGNYIIKGV